MIERSDIEKILNKNSEVEACIHLSRDGLVLQYQSRNNNQVEEMASIAGTFLAASRDSGLVSGSEPIRICITVGFGSMYIKELADSSVLCILTKAISTQQQMESIVTIH